MTDDNTDKPAIVLFRHDLRIRDNRALLAAAGSGKPVIPIFLWDETNEASRPIGGARKWWLHHSLKALGASLEKLGGRLILRRGKTAAIVDEVLDDTGADVVLWNRRYDPPGIAIDTALKAGSSNRGIVAESFEGHLLHEPYALKTGSGGYYRVYSPFWRALNAQPEPRDPLAAPRELLAWPHPVTTDSLDDWALLPHEPDWTNGFSRDWTPGEEGAHERLADFLDRSIDRYVAKRNRPDMEATSRLSPHLAHGEVTPFQIWHALKAPEVLDHRSGVEKFRAEVGWREFSWHLLFHNPNLHSENFKPAFDNFAWAGDAGSQFTAWKRGLTGYPIVDAGMRQLWQTGWMHNRVRMVVASFLIKHLLVDWREGEAWFWDTLVDADPANNSASWQWVAGSGADAAPYFRIFNPVLQGEKFDPKGDYVRKFVPELKALPAKFVHQPWNAPEAVLREANISLGETYPRPIVDHQASRRRALDAYSTAMR
ncbi:deoxyribodipyrimidine photo-lyase type I [Phyllobacterium sp. YR620]|uniref:cryptochrome/photolyase family protein n=1 Tax=Phyllobacterium sp. YR620 TaxID=1881066 RepID=UPI00088A388F|nr:deoxyribodipyrimidine photo-lyase [Phyllobacterium sp. YR620]SDP86375.1 deoxyribodipyrimidine photo-lyase type I [Phyllobacterium sp. YR620]